MGAMKRLVLIVLAVAAFAPATANAAVPCRDRIYNDWYADGKIATTYPVSCYRDAIKHVHADAATYSSLLDDIRSAMQAAIRRLNDKTATVPAQVGKGGEGGVEPAVIKLSPSKSKHEHVPPNEQARSERHDPGPATTIASGPTGSGGGGVPTPILILGALALLLAAIGAAGAGAKRFRRRPGA